MIVARYTSNVSGYVPTFNNGYVYSVNEQLNNGVYTVEIESDTDFSSVMFGTDGNNGITSLLSVEYLKITNKVYDLQKCFRRCTNVTSINTDGWDTSNVSNLGSTFAFCSALTSLDVSEWDTSNVTTLFGTFTDCSKLTSLDVSEWDTSNVTTLYLTFYGCSALTTLDLSEWDTSNVTDLQSTFYGCSQLTQLDVSNFDISKVTNTTDMFKNCNVENVGLIYCSKDTIDKLANCITSPCNFYVTNKTYTSLNPLVKYVMYREDKKRILYYNDETQTWEKPVLREWDSIEKHSDGKYYYHKRSGEVVLNGSENWALNREWQTDTLAPFYCSDFVDRKPNGELVFDRFSFHKNVVKSEYECAGRSDGTVAIYVNVLKSRLSTQDAAGFKAWLQANPVTVVYQLAEEKVYECTDLDLITYSGETNLLVKSGVLNPKVTLKVHQNITNIITILQNKVSVLENVFIQGLKQVLAGDMQSLAYTLYPEDFENIEQSIDETSLGEQQDDPTDK